MRPPDPGGALFASPAERAYVILGGMIGLVAGPMQAASRALLVRLAPQDRITQYFGLFALTGSYIISWSASGRRGDRADHEPEGGMATWCCSSLPGWRCCCG